MKCPFCGTEWRKYQILIEHTQNQRRYCCPNCDGKWWEDEE